MVRVYLEEGGSAADFKLNTKIGYLRDLTPKYLLKAYNHLAGNADIVSRSWTKAKVEIKGEVISLLDAWKPGVQAKALELVVARKLFPSQEIRVAEAADEIEDLLGKHIPDDRAEVSLSELVDALDVVENEARSIEDEDLD